MSKDGIKVNMTPSHPGDFIRTEVVEELVLNVNQAAEVALLASLEDRATLMERVRNIVAERERMMKLLREVPGVETWPSQANFILCRLPKGRGREIFDGLCRRGIFLRYFNNPGLEDHIRVSVGLPHETDAVISALNELVRE